MLKFSETNLDVARAAIARFPLEKVKQRYALCQRILADRELLKLYAKELKSSVVKTEASVKKTAELLAERL